MDVAALFRRDAFFFGAKPGYCLVNLHRLGGQRLGILDSFLGQRFLSDIAAGQYAR